MGTCEGAARFHAQVLPEYTTVMDSNRTYVDVSDSFCKLLGYEREELVGKKYDVVTAPKTNQLP
jgi:PAS domain S-box-containing protein